MRNIFSGRTALTLKWCFNPTWVFKWFGCPPSSTKDMLFELYEVCMDVLLLCTWTQHYRHKRLEHLNYSPSAPSRRTFLPTRWVKSCIFPPNCYGNYTIWMLGSHYAGTRTEYWVSILRMPSQRATVSECLSAGGCSTASCQSVSSRLEAASSSFPAWQWLLKRTLLLFCGNTSDGQLSSLKNEWVCGISDFWLCRSSVCNSKEKAAVTIINCRMML